MRPNRLIVFVKAPRPGQVKTRLAQSIGDDAAAEAYCALVETLLKKLEPLREVELRHAPDDAAEEISSWLRNGWSASPQGTGDLGTRLKKAFEDAFAAGAKRVVVIGSDCPDVTSADIKSAWAALETHHMVLGPATDGGYWLIGLRQARPQLFEGITWSTHTVLKETLEKARELGLSVDLLRVVTDVDTVQEWREFLAGVKL